MKAGRRHLSSRYLFICCASIPRLVYLLCGLVDPPVFESCLPFLIWNLGILFKWFTMSDIPVEAQQLVVDGIKAQPSRTPRVVLCHSSGCLVSDASCQVCTHDKFEEYFLRKSIKLISVLPSVGSIRRALQKFRGDSFSFEAILACHHSVDIMGLCIDILGRFGTDCNYIQEVHFLVNLPEGTFRKHATVAYSVLFKSNCDGNVRIRWKKPIEQYDEVMFPKYVLSHDVISNMLKRPGGPLVCHSKKRNGCFDFEGGQNNESLSFQTWLCSKGL